MMLIQNLLLIAGTGNKSGKTTFACRVIEQYRESGIVAVKITPHFHETTSGLILLNETQGYSIYEETDSETNKDTSRMLKSGAARVFFAKVTDKNLAGAFSEILEFIPSETPVVCESPALRYCAEPGVFVIMKSDENNNNKNINRLLELPHVMFHLSDILSRTALPFDFTEGKWKYTGDRI
ncbi:MAG: hypothetical protein QG576_39 [Bacteroidota bacterium]|nr:hypothetical protein [Bacteroidota bacterium]